MTRFVLALFISIGSIGFGSVAHARTFGCAEYKVPNTKLVSSDAPGVAMVGVVLPESATRGLPRKEGKTPLVALTVNASHSAARKDKNRRVVTVRKCVVPHIDDVTGRLTPVQNLIYQIGMPLEGNRFVGWLALSEEAARSQPHIQTTLNNNVALVGKWVTPREGNPYVVLEEPVRNGQ